MDKPAPGRQDFLDAAMRCFQRMGARRTRLVDIAREAGVTRQTLYNYFPGGKKTLIGELIVGEAHRVNARARRKLDLTAGPSDLLVEAAIELVLSARKSDLVEVLVTGGGLLASSEVIDSSPEIAAVMAEYWEPILSGLEERGELRPGLDHHETIAWLTFVHVALVARPDSFRGDVDEVRAALRRNVVPVLTGAFVT
jgi:AcrR family transcriptional regulator